jgi:hypothetical protein
MELPPRPDAGAWDPSAPRPTRSGRRTRLLAAAAALAVGLAALGGSLIAIRSTLAPPRGRPNEHRFLAIRPDGSPARWNPCEPIHYVVDPGPAPAGSVADVQEAVRRVSAATGISFVYDGLTTEVPGRQRGPYDATRYGDHWSPVLIGWVDPTRSDIPFDKGGETAAAVARPETPLSGGSVFVSGWIAMNASDPNPPGFAEPGDQGPTLLHEWGHVMGLDHVRDEGELMEPSGGGMTDYGPGDLAGLDDLGRSAGCLTTPRPGS